MACEDYKYNDARAIGPGYMLATCLVTCRSWLWEWLIEDLRAPDASAVCTDDMGCGKAV